MALRALNESYFERYYTKLIRWVSQGRLLRDSTRGVLLVDKERCLLGDSIAVRALLMDAQQLPLTAAEVAATLIHPDGRRTALAVAAIRGCHAGWGVFGTVYGAGRRRLSRRTPDASGG